MKKDLIKLLEKDEDIQALILAIVNKRDENLEDNSDEKIEALQKQLQERDEMIEKLKRLLGISKEDTSSLEKVNQKLAEDIKQLQSSNSKVNSEKEELNQALDSYKNSFEDLLKIEKIYNSLSSSTKDSLKNMLKNSSNSTLLFASLIQEKNVENLWEFIKNELIEDQNVDNDKLVNLFELVLNIFIKIFPQYSKNGINISDRFDTELHIKAKGSGSNITKILLDGWKNNQTNKIIKKTVVGV